jgi:hypothetical protein
MDVADRVVRTSASTMVVLCPRPTLEMSSISDGLGGGRLDEGFIVNNCIRYSDWGSISKVLQYLYEASGG